MPAPGHPDNRYLEELPAYFHLQILCLWHGAYSWIFWGFIFVFISTFLHLLSGFFYKEVCPFSICLFIQLRIYIRMDSWIFIFILLLIILLSSLFILLLLKLFHFLFSYSGQRLCLDPFFFFWVIALLRYISKKKIYIYFT